MLNQQELLRRKQTANLLDKLDYGTYKDKRVLAQSEEEPTEPELVTGWADRRKALDSLYEKHGLSEEQKPEEYIYENGKVVRPKTIEEIEKELKEETKRKKEEVTEPTLVTGIS